ncbi:hypothetical protein BDV12DRAFT_187061 [Aspergillus spectabilis]
MSDNAPRKRRRPAKACEQCRHRKVRCDLNVPCGPCTRAKTSLDCLYRDGRATASTTAVHRSSPDQTRSRGIGENLLTPTSIPDGATTNGDLQQAIRNIQGRLSTLEKRVSDSKTDEASALRPALQRELRALTERVDTIEGQLTTGSDAGYAAGALARDRTSFSISQMMSQKDPEHSLGELRNNSVSTIKDCRDLRQSIKSQRSVKFNDPLPDIRSTIPSKKECDELVHCYLRTFESIYRVIHVPSFWTEYEEYWSQPPSTSSPFLVKLLLILAIGTDETHQVTQKWIYAAQWWLAGPSETSTVNLDGLQVLCLLLVARKACGLGASPWLSAGSLMRMAVAMGLHRDPSRFASLPIFQAEMRLRLWATVLELELQESLDSATPVLVPPNVDAGAPSNVNDKDLSHSTSSIATSEPSDVVTDTSVQALLHDSVRIRMQVLEVIHNCQSQSYEQALDLGAKLRAICRKVAGFFRTVRGPQQFGSPLELTEFHAGFLDVQLHRYILAVYTPFIIRARKDPQYYYARKACLESAARITSYAGTLNVPSQIPDDLLRLFVSGKGSFKGPLSLDIISTLGLEIITQLEEDCPPPCLPGVAGDPLDRVADANRDHLIQTLEHILNQLFYIISRGTPSMKRYGLLAAVLGQIRAMKAGQDVKRTVYEAVTQSFKDCHSALQLSATHRAGSTEVFAAGPNVPGVFDESLFDLDVQGLFQFSGLDANIMALLG